MGFETPTPPEATPEKSITAPLTTIIQERIEIERKALKQGNLSFEAVKSNSGLLPEQPLVELQDSERTSDDIMEEGRRVDRIVCDGLRQELERHNLTPDNATFYLIDFGLPHSPAIQETLLEIGIDPSVFIQPSDDRLKKAQGYYQRYIDSYQEHRDRLFDLRKNLVPTGHALIISSHADKQEEVVQKSILPTIDKLKTMGVKRVVIGKETFYQEPQNVQQLTTESSSGSSEHLFVNQYARQLFDAGIEVFVIGFDYRYKPVDKPAGYEDLDPQYLPSSVELFDWGVAQNIAGKRLVFDKNTGRIYAIVNGQVRKPREDELVQFYRNLLGAGLTDADLEKAKQNLTEVE